jgi:hypothetical protein
MIIDDLMQAFECAYGHRVWQGATVLDARREAVRAVVSAVLGELERQLRRIDADYEESGARDPEIAWSLTERGLGVHESIQALADLLRELGIDP